MPATKSELSAKDDFRGDILDRDFPVHFDAKTGTYSYDYADVSAALASELDKIKYYRVSSPKLAEVEAEVVKHLKAESPKAPPVKGNITKAAEAEEEEKKSTDEIINTMMGKENLSENETEVFRKALLEKVKLNRPRKYKYAQEQQEKIYNEYNQKLSRGNAVNMNNTTKRPKLSEENQREFDTFADIIKASDYLEALDNKVKNGKELTEGEKTLQRESAIKINSFDIPIEASMNTKVKAINEKAKYNAAKVTVSQLKNKKNLSLVEQSKKATAEANILKYEENHPTVRESAEEQRELQTIELKRKELKTLNAKSKPLSPENQEKLTTLQAEVNAYNLTHATESAPLQVEGAKNIFEESKENTSQRNLSNEAFQARKAKAQKVLTSLGALGEPLSSEQTALQANAQAIVNAFTKLNNTTGTVKNANKQTARNVVRKSRFLNKARNLSIATEGGKRRTRKSKKSKRKTHKRKH